jgi:peptidoglycan/xylan/chitin deacetylase (PgdA/CDA1 family)
MDRRTFLRRGGVGAAVAAAGVAGFGAATLADHVEEDHQREGAEKGEAARGIARVVWSVATEERVLALTFDDGPHPRLTPKVLDALAAHDAHATFFVVGEAARRHPELVRRARDEGHEIGNHTWSHPREADISEDAVARNMVRGARELTAVTGTAPRWFRSPRGVLTGGILRTATSLGEEVAMWSAEAHDLHDRNPDHIARDLEKAVAPGHILLLHDGTDGRDDLASLERRRAASVAALDPFLTACRRAGYRFATLPELVALADTPSG